MSRKPLVQRVMKFFFMLTCQESSELVSQSLDHPLTFSDRAKLKLHLLMCKACHRFNRHLMQLRSAILSLLRTIEQDKSITLPPEAKANIIKKLTDEA